MAGYRKRQKASDVFKNKKFLFAGKTSFAKAFPTVKDIEVEVRESGDGITEWNRILYYTKDDIGEFLDCHNPRCYNGGFNVMELVRYMVREGQTELDDRKICQGHEGSPKGRRRYGRCSNHFIVKIKISYKN